MAITLISNIEPKNAGDFSILEDIYLDGGFRVVADTTERDAITVQRLKTGMLVYVVDITTTYRYTGSGWDAVNYLLADGTRELTADWNAGNFRITADDLKANNSLYLGSSEADSGIYFYDGGSETGESIYWDDSEGRFSTSNSFYIYGTLTAHVDVVAETVRSGGSFYAGNNQVVADTGYHFWNGTNFTKSLLWDYSEAEFIFNDDVNITGGLYVSSVLETGEHALIGTTSLVNDEMLRVYQSAEGGDCIIGGISSAGSNDYFIRLIEGASTNHFYVTKNLSYFSMPVQINGQLDLNGNLDLDADIRGDYAANILNTSTVADSHGLKVDSTVKNSYGLHVYAEGREVAKFASKLTTILNATTLDLGLTVNGTTVLNEGGSSTGDVRWESDLSIYGFVCDASANGGNGGIGIGTSSIPHGGIGYAKLAIEGLDSNAYGPHVQITTPTDNYPLLQIFNWRHDLISINFDSYYYGYYDGAYKSSDAGSNFAITKNGDKLLFRAESGIAAGNTITWKEAFSIASNGTVVFNDGSDSICDLRVETNTKSNALFIDSSNDIIYLNTTGVSSPYYSGSMLEGFEAITGNDLVAFSFNASMSSMDSGHWQAVLGGKGYTTIAAGEAAYGFFGEVVDTGNSTGGSLIGFQGNATVGTSQTGMGIETYHGVVASKAATTLHGLYSHAAYLGASASLGTAYGVYAEREIVATTNYTGWFGGRVKVATEGLIIPVVSTLPNVQLESGYMVIYENGTTRRLYMRAGTTWRYVNLT